MLRLGGIEIHKKLNIIFLAYRILQKWINRTELNDHSTNQTATTTIEKCVS